MSTVPDKKTSKARSKRRYKKWAYEKKQKMLKRTSLVTCPQCKEMKRSHTICPECGAYGKVKETTKKAEVKQELGKKDSSKAKKSPVDKETKTKQAEKKPDSKKLPKEVKKESKPKKKALFAKKKKK